jgi:hypothetical protein
LANYNGERCKWQQQQQNSTKDNGVYVALPFQGVEVPAEFSCLSHPYANSSICSSSDPTVQFLLDKDPQQE